MFDTIYNALFGSPSTQLKSLTVAQAKDKLKRGIPIPPKHHLQVINFGCGLHAVLATNATNPWYMPGVQMDIDVDYERDINRIKTAEIRLQQSNPFEERNPYRKSKVPFRVDWKYLRHDMDDAEYKQLAIDAFELFLRIIPPMLNMEIKDVIREHTDSRLAWTARLETKG